MATHLVCAGAIGATHAQGGPGPAGVHCTICDRPLLLLWDLDGRDPVVQALFGAHVRVPILYCWRCAGEVSYHLTDAGIALERCDGEPQGDDFPYDGYPNAFPRAPLQLVAVPDAIVAELDALADPEVDREDVADRVGDWWPQIAYGSHLGETVVLWQGARGIPCPACDSDLFREVAVIHDDGLPFLAPETGSSQAIVVASSCSGCGLISVTNQAD